MFISQKNFDLFIKKVMKVFDSHFHIINPDYPLTPNNGYLPDPFTVADYRMSTKTIDIRGGAIVSGSFQAFEQEYLIHALKDLGKDYVGVANIPLDMPQDELKRLDDAGVVAVRFNVNRGGSETIENVGRLSNELFDKFGWHTELYINSRELSDLKHLLLSIPSFSIDHLGLSKDGLDNLYYWAEKGIKVKATGFGRLDFEPIKVIRELYKINPHGIMFGSDLPSTRSKTPFSMKDLELLTDNFSEVELDKILFSNAYNFYKKNAAPDGVITSHPHPDQPPR